MARRRRATDRPPFSEMVTRGNLDDRLDTLLRMLDADHRLDVERWHSHAAAHEVVADALREYKKDSNEWRQTLTDLRGTFIPKAEYMAEHRGLDAKLHGEVEKLAAFVATMDSRLDVLTSDLKDVHTEQTARRSVWSDGRNILITVSLAFGIVASALLLIDRVSR